MSLHNLVPDIRDLQALEAEEVGGVLLEYLHSLSPNHSLHPSNVLTQAAVAGYPNGMAETCLRIFGEGWNALEREGFIALFPASHGAYFITRRGERLKSRADFNSYRLGRQFPKETVHPLLVADTYPMFLRGQYEAAIFQAFKLIEVEVRDACPQFKDKLGVQLVTHAFRPEGGPLSDPSEPEGERVALMNLFAGAIGRFKNPASHRRIPNLTATDAIEAIQFASHLLRVVDERRPGGGP